MNSPTVRNILSKYESDNDKTLGNLAKLLNFGKLGGGGTGKLIILSVDQGFEHDFDRSFGINPDVYDPHYHTNLAVEASLSTFGRNSIYL